MIRSSVGRRPPRCRGTSGARNRRRPWSLTPAAPVHGSWPSVQAQPWRKHQPHPSRRLEPSDFYCKTNLAAMGQLGLGRRWRLLLLQPLPVGLAGARDELQFAALHQFFENAKLRLLFDIEHLIDGIVGFTNIGGR